MSELSPQPILPGVPVPFPCWLLNTALRRWAYYTSQPWFEAKWEPSMPFTHYLLAPATADPATFPKPPSAMAEQKERGESLSREYPIYQVYIAHPMGVSTHGWNTVQFRSIFRVWWTLLTNKPGTHYIKITGPDSLRGNQ